MVRLGRRFSFQNAGEFERDLLAVDLIERAGQIGQRGIAQRVAVAIEAVACGKVGAFVAGQGVEDDCLAVVVIGIETGELFEQEGGGLFDGVLVDGNPGIAGGDERPEHAGRGVAADDFAVPTTVLSLGGHKTGDQGTGILGEPNQIDFVHLARIGISEGGGGGQQFIAGMFAPARRHHACHVGHRSVALHRHVEHRRPHVGADG